MPHLSHPYRVYLPEGPREYWRDFTHKKMREDVFRHLFSSYLNINGKLLKMSIQKYAITERISFLKFNTAEYNYTLFVIITRQSFHLNNPKPYSVFHFRNF